MIKLILLLALSFPVNSGTLAVLLIGQSNSDSQASLAEGFERYDAVIPDVSIYTNHQPYWMKLRPGQNTQRLTHDGNYRGTFGIETSMAERLHRRSGDKIKVIKVPFGATTLKQIDGFDWSASSEGEGFDRAVDVVKSSGLQPDVVVWVHGEADVINGYISEYGQNERDFVAALRFELDQSDLPFISVFLNEEVAVSPADNKALNNQKGANRSQVAYYHTVSAARVTFKDRVHYDTASTIMMGRRAAERVCQVLECD